jgi:DNA-directed RNA polymerase specialized sigma24 family protein
MGEFRSLLFTIARRRIADYLDKKRVDETRRSTSTGARALGSATPPTHAASPIRRSQLTTRAFNQAFSDLNDTHKLVIAIERFEDLSHSEIAVEVNRQFRLEDRDSMTEQNVNQINSRFEKRLDELLREADDPSPPNDDD